MRKGEPSGRSCRLCNQPDSADSMVACDACNLWYHFSCVSVNSSISDRAWICPQCQAEAKDASTPNAVGVTEGEPKTLPVKDHNTRSVKGTGSKTSKKSKKTVDGKLRSRQGSAVSSVSSAILADQLELLKEQESLQEEELKEKEELECLEFEEKQRQLDEQRRRQEEEAKLREEKLAKQKALREERLRLKRQSLEKRQEILRQHAEMSERGSIISGSGISKILDGSKVQEWLTDNCRSQDGETEDPSVKGTNPKLPPQLPLPPAPLDNGNLPPNPLPVSQPPPVPVPVGNGNPPPNPLPVSQPPPVAVPVGNGNPPPNPLPVPQLPPVPVSVGNGNLPPNPLPILQQPPVPDPSGNGNLPSNLPQNPQPALLPIPFGYGNPPLDPRPRSAPLLLPSPVIDGNPQEPVQTPQPSPPPVPFGYGNPPQEPIPSSTPLPPPEDPLLLLARRLRELSLGEGNRQPVNPSTNPAYLQMAARQVTGKDLPFFNGNPEDWPMFIRIFEETTAACGFSNVENQVRLQKCLRGNALETVRSRLLMPEGVPHVIKTLEMRFGRPDLIIRSMLDRIQRLPSPKPERLETLIDFGLAVQNLVVHLQAANQASHLNNPTLLQELVAKLPAQLKLDWAKYKLLHTPATLATFGDFMEQLIQAASEVCFDVPVNQSSKPEKARNKEKPVAHSYSHEKQTERHSPSSSKRNEQATKTVKPCQFCKEPGHRVAGCNEFGKKTIEDRLKFVQQNNLCRTCLNFHQKWPCKTWKGCNVDGCREKHHSLLHPPVSNNPVHLSSSHSSVNNDDQDLLPYFRILPVVLHKGDMQQLIFAFIDEGSSSTLLDRSVADFLKIDGPVEPLTLQWTGNVTRKENASKRVQLSISGKGKPQKHQLQNARTVDQLLLPRQSLSYRSLSEKYPHLRGLPIDDYRMVEPKLLIGLDNLSLGIPLKIREGGRNAPIAAKCRLGWTIYGSGAVRTASTVSVNFHVPAIADPDREMNQQLNDYFTLEQAGVEMPFAVPESEADQRARRLLEETTRRLLNRFETGLLWKKDVVEFPDSYPMAVRRLEALERKLARDSVLKARVHEQLDEYVAKGYCHRATPEELAAADKKRVWYLPLGIVVNPRKPNKVRLVWDAAAQVNGVSFNSALLKGPDLLTPLIAVLSHFREYKIAVSGDIKEMFLRMLICLKDRQSQRFLWRKTPGEAPQIYIIDVATFGSTCSPSSAQFVKNLNAKDYMDEFPRAATAIVKYHYVDDYLDSFASVEEAIEVVKRVKYIHAQGGFEIRNFLSNSEQLLAAIEDVSQEEMKELNISRAEKTESVLGMRWNPHDDAFSYALSPREEILKIMEPAHIPTKREMLKLVMSLFDPLGFITFFLIHGRILIQEVWAAGLDWDTPINERILQKWRLWLSQFPSLNSLRIPRCYFRHAMRELKQLHVFVDASKEAYACVAYITATGPDGIEVALVAAKSKVAPIKVLSVPRLELKAAVLGTRLAEAVISSHSYLIDRKFFWSDSKTVLAWINSDHRRYHQFVGVRIGEILSSTRMNEWRYVRSGQNAADPATKWGSGPNFDLGSLWFRGPSFLYRDEEEWPENRRFNTATELTNAQHSHWQTPKSLIDVSRFSKWERLQRTQAYVIRFIENLKRSRKGERPLLGVLLQEELQRAEKLLWKQAQIDIYEMERRTLLETQGDPNARHNLVPKSSSIYKLRPYLDVDGLLRMRGRIGAAWYAPYEAKYPVILPDTHLISSLLTDWFHRRYHHVNHETVVNEMRQRYEIPRLRVLVKRISKGCFTCRLAKAVPHPPPMAPLLKQRLAPFVRPFSYVGVDYFGPLLVRVGRAETKRWVALFTCMTVRAIHLEVVHSLSTESCVMAIRRFIARRGAPVEFFSDNGTCFVGANEQLQGEIQRRNDILATTFTNANTRWSFNPPAAPHMGGVWERLVRSVKQAIGTILDAPRKPNDETLATILADAESMINSRPLTYVPLETADEESLTPNHFLLGSSSGVKQPPSEPVDYRTNLRSSWALAQHITDTIWRRWIKEYLPVIRRQGKWFDEVRDIQKGDLVLMVGGAVRNQYVRARVDKVFMGRDGRVRSALVRTAGGVYKRPVVRLALLDVGLNGETIEDSSGTADHHQVSRAGDCYDERVEPPGSAVTELPDGNGSDAADRSDLSVERQI